MSSSGITGRQVIGCFAGFIVIGSALTALAVGTLKLTKVIGEEDFLWDLTDKNVNWMMASGGGTIGLTCIVWGGYKFHISRKNKPKHQVTRPSEPSNIAGTSSAPKGHEPVENKDDRVEAAAGATAKAKPDEKAIRDGGCMQDAILTWDGQKRAQSENTGINVIDSRDQGDRFHSFRDDHHQIHFWAMDGAHRYSLSVQFQNGTSLEKIKEAIINHLPEKGNYVLLSQNLAASMNGDKEHHFLSEDYFQHMLLSNNHISIEIQKIENMAAPLQKQCGQNILIRSVYFGEQTAGDPEKESFLLCPREDVVKNLKKHVTKRKNPDYFDWEIWPKNEEIKLNDISTWPSSRISLTLKRTARTAAMAESVIEHTGSKPNNHLTVEKNEWEERSNEYYYITVAAQWKDGQERYYRFKRDLTMDELKEGLKYHLIRNLGNMGGNYVMILDKLFCDEHLLFTKLQANPEGLLRLNIYKVTEYQPDPIASNNILIIWDTLYQNTRGVMLCPKATIDQCRDGLILSNTNPNFGHLFGRYEKWEVRGKHGITQHLEGAELAELADQEKSSVVTVNLS